MKVLFTSTPAFGHLLPVMPLAAAARRAGDTVLVSTGPEFADVVGELPFAAAGPALTELMAEHFRRFPHFDMADLSDPVPTASFFTSTRVDTTLAAASEVAERFRPDLIVAEETDCVAPLVAATLGVPWLEHEISVEQYPPLARAYEEGLAARLAERGLTAVPRLGRVEPWPDWLRSDGRRAAPDALPIRPQPFDTDGADHAPVRPAGRDDRPLVLVTLGTVVQDQALLDAVVTAVAALDVDVVVTGMADGGPGSAASPRDAPNVRTVGFVPLARLLQGVSVTVAAGGAGTVLASLSRGVPMVLMPVLGDQPLIADRVAATGAAAVVSGPEAVQAALRTVLDGPAHRTAAALAAERIAGMPDADTVWAAVRELAGEPRPGTAPR